MSDGPHRSLNMRPAWKRLASFADNVASSPEDIQIEAEAALRRDWALDVPREIITCVKEVLGEQQESLFRNEKVLQLEALRPLTAGHELAGVFVECAIQAASRGEAGEDAIELAAQKTVEVWSARQARDIEEHYGRRVSPSRTAEVCQKVQDGLAAAATRTLARSLLHDTGQTIRHRAPKQTGLDDGVPL